MPLTADEFIWRFLLHVLPSGFHRIRYYGFLGNRHRKEKLEHCRQLLGMAPPKEGSAERAIQEDYRDRYERLHGPLSPGVSRLSSRSHDRGQGGYRFVLLISNDKRASVARTDQQ